MPYIKPEDRARIGREGGLLAVPRSAGEVNYLVSCLIAQELREKGKSYALFNEIVADLDDAKGMVAEFERFPNSRAGLFADIAFRFVFQTADLDTISEKVQTVPTRTFEEMAKRIVSARGAFECAKLELYIRIIRPYEDQKIHDNGDVYEVGGVL